MKKQKGKEKKVARPSGKLTEKAELAMENGFYLEASMICSSLFEKKLKKLLATIEKQAPGAGFTLEQSIKRVKYLHIGSKHLLLNAHFRVELIDAVRNWKNQRNEILKDLTDIHVSQARMERLASEGNRLLKEWKKADRSFRSEKS